MKHLILNIAPAINEDSICRKSIRQKYRHAGDICTFLYDEKTLYLRYDSVFEIVFHRVKHKRTLIDYDEEPKAIRRHNCNDQAKRLFGPRIT